MMPCIKNKQRKRFWDFIQAHCNKKQWVTCEITEHMNITKRRLPWMQQNLWRCWGCGVKFSVMRMQMHPQQPWRAAYSVVCVMLRKNTPNSDHLCKLNRHGCWVFFCFFFSISWGKTPQSCTYTNKHPSVGVVISASFVQIWYRKWKPLTRGDPGN